MHLVALAKGNEPGEGFAYVLGLGHARRALVLQVVPRVQHQAVDAVAAHALHGFFYQPVYGYVYLVHLQETEVIVHKVERLLGGGFSRREEGSFQPACP